MQYATAMRTLLLFTLVVAGCTPSVSTDISTTPAASTATAVPVESAAAAATSTGVPLASLAPVTDEERAVAKAGNELGGALYRELAKKEKGNLFFSPNSIEVALAMTAAGARGTTEKEMLATLRLPSDAKAREAGFAAQLARINGTAGSREYALKAANAIWIQKGTTLLPDYLQRVSTTFGGAARELDFMKAAEPSRTEINTWIEDQTEKRIQDLLPKGTITPATRLVLTNAIYFKGKWAEEFDPKHTQSEPFHAPGKKVTAAFMNATRVYPYARIDGIQVLELPYRGNELSMVVLLPEQPDGLAALEAKLGPLTLDAWSGPLTPKELAVSLPRFKMTVAATLNEPLKALGMKSAFSDDADFSGMTGGKGTAISDVLHKAFVEVNEEGTEAAAATAVVMRTTSVEPPPEPFKADHPFVFFIRDKSTGAILFIGRVVDPS